MEGLNSSSLGLLLDNILKNNEHMDNITINYPESNGAPAHEFTSLEMVYAFGLVIILVFGSIGNILTFIIMRKGSMKDVSTCFYMSILALADFGK